jgi:hypothetical protein
MNPSQCEGGIGAVASGSLGIGSGQVSKGNEDETNKLESMFAMSFQL